MGSVPSRTLCGSHHDLTHRQRLGLISLLSTVFASGCEQTTPTTLRDAEETLTDTDKAGAIGASPNRNVTSLHITAHNTDKQIGEGTDEYSTTFTDVPNMVEEDAYSVACRKVVRKK